MPGVKSEFASNTDFLTPFELYSEEVETDQNEAAVTTYIDLRDSVSALNNTVVVVLTTESVNTTSATVNLYVRTASGSLEGKHILFETKPASNVDQMLFFKDVYAGAYKVVLTDIVGGPIDVHVSHSDLRGQFVLGDL
jgi:hypothetical protein